MDTNQSSSSISPPSSSISSSPSSSSIRSYSILSTTSSISPYSPSSPLNDSSSSTSSISRFSTLSDSSNSSASVSAANLSSPPYSLLILMESPFRGTPAMQAAFFSFFLCVFALTLVGNLLLLAVILRDKRLHKPMYVMLGNLVVSDLLGSTSTVPRIMHNIVASNAISGPECFAQMFFAHVYGVLSGLALAAMTVDRYLAVCQPLRYPALVTPTTAMRVNLGLVAYTVLTMGALVGMASQHDLCKERVIYMPHCDHISVIGLACDDTTASSLYDLVSKLAGLTGCLSVVAVAYLLIAFECHKRSVRESQAKAVRTVVTHLMVVAIFFLSGLLIVAGHRIRAALGLPSSFIVYLVVNFHVLPSLMNPVIYGLCSAEIRAALVRMFARKVGP